jgi:type VI secretion system protein ImpG
MNDAFLRYYELELDFIRKMGAEFAASYPHLAGQLQIEADRCEDPFVERLIEAFAFLTARIRKKLDDQYPEITEAFLSVVFPHYLRPVPSMAIVQFVAGSDPTRIAGGQTIPAGSPLTTRVVDGMACRFRTAYPTALWPVSIPSASLAPDRVPLPSKPPEATALLRLELRCSSPTGWPALHRFDRLRVYLDGNEPVPSALYECLFNGLCAVWLRGKTEGGEERTIRLRPDAVRPVGFAADETLLPYPGQAFPGYRLLQEFFAFPSKFLFFDLTGLDAIAASGMTGPVEALFFLTQPPRTEVVVRAENFRLGCTPVVNLFPRTAEPIRLSHFKTEYRIVPDSIAPHGHEVFSVDEVSSTGGFLDEPVKFDPFYAMRHGSKGAGQAAYWYAMRRPSVREHDDGTEVDLAFSDPGFNPTVPGVEAVTVHLTCTNRDLPTRLPYGGGDSSDFHLEADAPVGRVRLLTRPTRPLRPPAGRSTHWRLISQLGLNHLSLVENPQGAEALRQLLGLYDFADTAVTRKMIAGIMGVASRRVAGRTGNRLGHTLSLGVEVEVRFDEDAFAGAGAFLMACVLERFLGAYVTINSFTRLKAVSKQRDGVWKQWPPRCGDRTLL